jgi:hypothetical protein
VKFTLPYFQSREPLAFTDSSGRTTKVTSFGIRSEDEYAYDELRQQSRVLFRNGDSRDKDFEFAVDLCATSSPSQMLVARITGAPTLAAACKRIETEEAELRRLSQDDPGGAESLQRMGPNDVLLVPDLLWRISHRFSELELTSFENAGLTGQRLDVAQQDIFFRLDRGGAELRSESKMYCKPEPTHFVLDGPFLIYMKMRGAAMPYFVLWVDNAELLSPWRE